MKIPPPEAPMTHFTKVELRFNDFDMLGHLNNTVFFEITDLAKARFMEWLLKKVDWRHYDLAIVNINCSFYSQIFPDSNVGVFTGVKSIGNSSFVLEQRVVDWKLSKVFAVTTSVFSAYDRATLKSKPLPDLLRAHLEESMSIISDFQLLPPEGKEQ